MSDSTGGGEKAQAQPVAGAESFPALLIKNIPSWTLSVCATMFAVVVSFKLLGVDLGQPMQTVTDAYASAISAQARGMLAFDEATKRFEVIMAEQRTTIEGIRKDVTISIEENAKATADLGLAIRDVRDIVNKLDARISALEKSNNVGSIETLQ
jgi:hypothetical protein